MSLQPLDKKRLTLNDFDYPLDPGLIAQKPLESRNDSKLLIWDPKSENTTLCQTSKFIDQLKPGSVVVLNNSKVFPSRLNGNFNSNGKSGKVEIFLLEAPTDCPTGAPACFAKALGKPMKKLQIGSTIALDKQLEVEVLAKKEDHTGTPVLTIKINQSANQFLSWATEHATLPLPPYIHRSNSTEETKQLDRNRYQTTFAKIQGSVAAPTAGLHFTKNQIQHIKEKGIHIAEVTLHVGAGTFMPVKSESPDHHFMHQESYQISLETWNTIHQAKANSSAIVCIGTTSFRCIESLASELTHLSQPIKNTSLCGKFLKTSLFVYPKSRDDRYQPKIADMLFTNFHQPKSTLFMLICALIGFEQAKKLYQQAVSKKLRFFSYGDASLLSWTKKGS